MKLSYFQMRVREHTDKLRDLIEQLPQKELKEEYCQKICLLNRLFDLEKSVNGTTEDDMEDS